MFACAFIPGTSTLSTNFLRAVERAQPFDTNPIYALLHESIYLDGPGVSSSWAAGQALQDDPVLSKAFDYTETMDPAHPDPVLLFGEMVYAFMFEDYAELKPLKSVADSLASRSDWGPLYVSRSPRSGVAAAAAVYHDDMYVDRDLSHECLKGGNALEFVKPYVTNEYQHSGLRDAGGEIFDKLMELAKD